MDANRITPHFEFGFGLSYTTFKYSSLHASASEVSFKIENTGSRDGTEIPQLYIAFPAEAGEPPLVLRGFEDVFVTVGQTVTVKMKLSDRDLG
jgi:beta-glucosidase